MQTGAAVADLSAGHKRKAVTEARGRSRTAGALRDVFVNLAVLERTRAEAHEGRNDQLRVDLLDVLPGETHAIEHAGDEVFNLDVAALLVCGQDLVALRVLCFECVRTLVVVEHRELEAVRIRNMLELTAGN